MALLQGRERMRGVQSEKMWQSHRWLMHMGVAFGYALAYLPLRSFSEDHWPVIAGFRMACLLLVPYQYWLALVLGESVAMIEPNMRCLEAFGVTWVVMMSVPKIALGMPIVWWFRSRAGLFPSCHQVNIKPLLCCALILSVVWAATNTLILATVRLPTGPYHMPAGTSFAYVLDSYLAILAVVPWAVMFRTYRRLVPKELLPLREMVRKRAFRHVSLATLAFTVLTFLHGFTTDAGKLAVLTMLFLLVVWLTFDHGWASVLGGTAALLCTRFLLDWKVDPTVLQMHVVMAFAITGLYMFGAHVCARYRQHEQLRKDVKQTQHVAKERCSLVSSACSRRLYCWSTWRGWCAWITRACCSVSCQRKRAVITTRTFRMSPNRYITSLKAFNPVHGGNAGWRLPWRNPLAPYCMKQGSAMPAKRRGEDFAS